ncbi:MAG TPA: hypothetical protein VF680_14790 [Allosphingosinicella sp.]|jgi:Dyp-type peroxidase family
MALNLTRPAEQVNFDTDASYAPMLANLQANILWSHGRDHARHIFIRFIGDPGAARAWIRNTVEQDIMSAAEQRQQKADRHRAKGENRTFDGGLVVNFFLSATGYAFLGFDPALMPSKGFSRGMKDRRDFDGPGPLRFSNRDPKPAEWEPGYRGEIHALVTLADNAVGADLSRLLAKLALYKSQIEAGLGVVTQVEEGRKLERPISGHPTRTEPIEHFGYFDGISQPLFTIAELDEYYKEQERAPQAGDWKPDAELNLVLARDPFAAVEAYGSFFVYRKLEQDYATFKERVQALAAAVPISEELAGAYVVGRFKDGTPTTHGETPDPGLVTANHFMHSKDSEGLKCPLHAHIRKANPRGTTPATSLSKERAKRIVRRGIPYGKPHPDLECDPADFETQEDGPRGLIFMCFQANIEKQFEFIQRVWVDNEEFPRGILEPDTGDDPLIGQHGNAAQKWPRKWNNADAGRRAFNFEAAVTLKGGEYLFAPSLAFLRNL